MRKLMYLAITFSVCCIFGLSDIWLGFTLVLLCMSLFSFENSFLWEIPLAVLSCNVINIAFADDMKPILQLMILVSTVVVSWVSPRKLPFFFLVSVIALVLENQYSTALVFATLWYGARRIFHYFTTKKNPLQEYKL